MDRTIGKVSDPLLSWVSRVWKLPRLEYPEPSVQYDPIEWDDAVLYGEYIISKTLIR